MTYAVFLLTVCIGVLNKIYKAIPAEDSSNQDKILKSLQDVCAGLKGKEHKFVSCMHLKLFFFVFKSLFSVHLISIFEKLAWMRNKLTNI